MSNTNFFQYVSTVLIPDLRSAGQTATAQDLNRLLNIAIQSESQLIEIKRVVERVTETN